MPVKLHVTHTIQSCTNVSSSEFCSTNIYLISKQMFVVNNGWNIKVVAVIPCKSERVTLILVLNFLLKVKFLILFWNLMNKDFHIFYNIYWFFHSLPYKNINSLIFEFQAHLQKFFSLWNLTFIHGNKSVEIKLNRNFCWKK